MTDLKFAINGVDFSDIVADREYTTMYTPVAGKSYTNLNMVKRITYARYKGGIIVNLNPLSAVRAAQLYTVLLAQPCQVNYFSFQRNAEVIETMETAGINIQDGFSKLSLRWGSPSSLEFIEL